MRLNAADIRLVILEFSLLALFLIAVVVVSSILIYRNLKKEYKDVWKQQSKFDVELRKAYNLVSKLVRDPAFDRFHDVIVKDLSHEDKKELLALVDASFAAIDATDPDNKYVVETFHNLQEIRVEFDAKVLSYNKKISYFPFNAFARFYKMNAFRHYTPHQ